MFKRQQQKNSMKLPKGNKEKKIFFCISAEQIFLVWGVPLHYKPYIFILPVWFVTFLLPPLLYIFPWSSY